MQAATTVCYRADDALTATPICDKLLELGDRDLVSFHALPLTRLRSVRASRLQDSYERLLGGALLRHDLTCTGSCFDTPVVPRRCVEQSRQLTARAFGATHTSYLTTGTTTGNWVAVFALAGEGMPVLADRLCHQSIHLALARSRATVTYGQVRRREADSGRSALDVDAFVAAYRAAAEAGRPYKVVILNGCSYEGVVLDVREILAACLEIHDDVTFLVDEAWFAFAAFHPLYRPFTAMHAGRALAAEYPGKKFAVVATQSAHKSLSCLRQGSYLHVHGDDAVARRVKEVQYQLHTTSPSYPLLAALELARAQAVAEGEERIENALHLAASIRQAIRTDPKLAAYGVNESAEMLDGWTWIDPLRISIDVRRLGVCARDVKEYLFARHGLYINHVTGTALLAHVHIGVDQAAVERLLDGLRSFTPTTQPLSAWQGRLTTK
jgi:arginine/lysine/ornithine decarboxylase